MVKQPKIKPVECLLIQSHTFSLVDVANIDKMKNMKAENGINNTHHSIKSTYTNITPAIVVIRELVIMACSNLQLIKDIIKTIQKVIKIAAQNQPPVFVLAIPSKLVMLVAFPQSNVTFVIVHLLLVRQGSFYLIIHGKVGIKS